jgi:hypothetical protein
MVAALLGPGAASPGAAQDLPECDQAMPISQCRLPAWPASAQPEVPSPFGAVDGSVWVNDPSGDVGPNGLDIAAVGIGSVEIVDPAPLRRDPDVLRRGRRNQAVRLGPARLVRVVLDRPIDQIADGYAGIHVATDIDGSRTNNAPAGVGSRRQPFAGSEDVYSVSFATTTGRTQLLDSDLARGWFRDRDAFAAAWAAPNVLDVLIRPEGLGAELRVVTHTSAADGGYDVMDLGPGGVPVDGVAGLRPVCVEATIAVEPFVVRRLVENGQILRNVEAPASWSGGAAFRLDAETRAALEAFLASVDEDGDGRVEVPASVDLFEDGKVIGQRPTLLLAVEGDTAQLAVQLGLTRRGFDVLRQLTPEATGDAAVDAWLAEATDAVARTLPPFRVGRRGGQLVGDGPGTCLTVLIGALGGEASDAQPSPTAEPSPTAVPAASPGPGGG